MITSAPNQIGSTPAAVRTGRNSGTQISTLAVQSRTKPSRKTMHRNRTSVPLTPRPRSAVRPWIRREPPLAAKMPVNMMPPATISRIIAEMRTVIARDSRIIDRLNWP
ncbi:hypothetical protein D9M70_614420 [compost metagenome]